MTFLRPEAKAQLVRWREVLAGGAMVVLGLWWLLGPGRLLVLPALALLAGGAALVWVGVQRARFRSAGQGPGAVRVDEGQITYFGPLTGGSVALREMTELVLDKTFYPAHWRLTQPGQPDLLIPVNAEGAEALFDAFATLSGLRTERMLNALQGADAHAIVIWQRAGEAAAPLRLH
ncbi:hypothetical protein So717_24830 [Roseobacter cerasinus]|uniref:Uncharacterized protein n=1 Tax=Roseobacter cerasinus TaxID=2602289 RepID=A0A640VTH8_9RHOB|nr:hypothetical protein [Roseobacter cerasinus]GFE50730.1 hypothetical protein So717_24830 [Roseobacter cerasinus]